MLVAEAVVTGGALNGGLLTVLPAAEKRECDNSSIIGAPLAGVASCVVAMTSENQRRCRS